MAAAYEDAEHTLEVAKPTSKDETQEWSLLRVLIEYGHLAYDGYESVAKMIEERVDPAMIEHQVVGKLFNEYFDHFTHFGSIPEIHYFVNHPEPDVRERMASLLHSNTDISPNWKDKYGIDSVTGPMSYVVDVDSTMSYFELKKIIGIQDELMKLLSTEQDPAKQQRMMMKFVELRKMEREILVKHKQVVYKSLKSK